MFNSDRVFSIWLAEFYRLLKDTDWNGGPVLNCSNHVVDTWSDLLPLFIKRYSPALAVESLDWPF